MVVMVLYHLIASSCLDVVHYKASAFAFTALRDLSMDHTNSLTKRWHCNHYGVIIVY